MLLRLTGATGAFCIVYFATHFVIYEGIPDNLNKAEEKIDARFNDYSGNWYFRLFHNYNDSSKGPEYTGKINFTKNDNGNIAVVGKMNKLWAAVSHGRFQLF